MAYRLLQLEINRDADFFCSIDRSSFVSPALLAGSLIFEDGWDIEKSS